MPWDSVDKWRDEDYWPERAELGGEQACQPTPGDTAVPGAPKNTLPLWPALLIWAAFFVCLALNVHG